MQLVFLAAGRGSRLPKKFRENPKCLTKINGITIFERNFKFFKRFEEKINITGYKKNKLASLIKLQKFKEIFNNRYKSTNMVHSLMLSRKYIKKSSEITICYGDIIFNKNIFSILKKNKGNIMPVNSNWLRYWKKRMSTKKVMDDAEDMVTYKNKLINIGDKIKNKIPLYQYMGIFKINRKTLNKMYLFYKKINTPKIDMTSFLSLCIKNKILSMKIVKYSGIWHEIDHHNDIKIAERELN